MEIGFMGLGNMGAPLARRLVRAGMRVRVYNRTPHKVAAVLEAGSTATQVFSLADMAGCDVFFTCLALPEHVQAATTGTDGVYQYLRPDAVHVEMSTIAPETALELCKAAARHGVAYVQCTLGKTPAHAEAGQAPLFIGGDTEAIQALDAVFALLGLPNNVGTVEAACAVKLISNLVGMTNVLVLAEGLRLGQAAGLEPTRLLPLLQDTGARSFQLDVRGPWMATEDTTPRFALDLALKDLRLGCRMAEHWGLTPQTMQTALEVFARASAAGHGAEDCCAVYGVAGSLPSDNMPPPR